MPSSVAYWPADSESPISSIVRFPFASLTNLHGPPWTCTYAICTPIPQFVTRISNVWTAFDGVVRL